MSVTLQTDRDEQVERYVIARIMNATNGRTAYRFPAFSIVDYMIGEPSDSGGEGKVMAFLEIKGRKETSSKVRSYGGLMLKARKFDELVMWEEATKTLTLAVFAFENGAGEIYYCSPAALGNRKSQPPPPRRNFRNLTCDDEPVVYLDWDKDLTLMLGREEST